MKMIHIKYLAIVPENKNLLLTTDIRSEMSIVEVICSLIGNTDKVQVTFLKITREKRAY